MLGYFEISAVPLTDSAVQKPTFRSNEVGSNNSLNVLNRKQRHKPWWSSLLRVGMDILQYLILNVFLILDSVVLNLKCVCKPLQEV